MEAGLRPYRMEPADLSETVSKVLSRMETQFSQGHFEVKTAIEPDLPRIMADEGAAEQAAQRRQHVAEAMIAPPSYIALPASFPSRLE